MQKLFSLFKIQALQLPLNIYCFADPQFVGSFSLKESVLFFFRETATEIDPSEHKVYSRVAKVCKVR